jgi:hypothetical protein
MEGRWKYKIVKEIYKKSQFDSTNYIMDSINHFEEKVNSKMSFEQWEPIGGLEIKELGILVLVTQNLKKFVPFESFIEDDLEEEYDDEYGDD